jgi:uncharacterized protein with FMN-binding domain
MNMEGETRGRKRWVAWLVAAVVLLGGFVGWMAGCRSSPTPVTIDMSTLRDGNFEGESYKFPGSMVVAVQVEKGKIAKIEVKKQAALKKYTDILKPMIDKIIEKQTADVDDITGATISSRALRRAVRDALVKSTGTPPAPREEKAAGNP